MKAVILCGGKSTRMGSDKGLLQTQSLTWSQKAVALMNGAIQLPVLVSVNETQYRGYNTIFEKEQLVKDDKTLDVNGPLRGLLSVHILYPREDLFLLACDMPLMEAAILLRLLHAYQKEKADAYVYVNDGEFEPLCGIYTATAIAKIAQMHRAGKLSRHSMRYVLEQVDTFSIPLKEEEKKYFRNFNTHADLNGL